MASIRVEDEALTDPRFTLLGQVLHTTRFDAVGRMLAIWSYCTEKHTYYLTEKMIDVLAEVPGFTKIISEPEIGLAVQSDKGFRIKGTRGRIEWLKKLRNNGKKGGRPKKTKTKPNGFENETKSEPPSNPLTITPAPVPALVLKKVNTDTHAPVPPKNRPNPNPPIVVTPDELSILIEEAGKIWLETLGAFGAGRTNLLEAEKFEIRRAVKRHGVKAVSFALEGVRYDAKPSDKFDRAKFLSLDRVLPDKELQRWINLALITRNKAPS